jgi:PAS domain S-box-containing protein
VSGTVSDRRRPHWALRYGWAVASVTGFVLLKRVMDPLYDWASPFLLLFAPVMLSAWYGGFGPGLLATGLAAGVIDYYFLAPRGLLRVDSLAQATLLGVFVAEATLITYLTRRARWATERAEDARLQAETELSRREHAEAALRDAQPRMVAILESITDAFYGLDLEWRFTYVNRGAEQILGAPKEELIGQSLWHRFPELVDTQLDVELRRARADGVVADFAFHDRPRGRWFEVRAYPADRGLSVYLLDISDRVRLEAERTSLQARQSELTRQLHALTDAALALRVDATDSIDEFLQLVTDRTREIIGAHQAVTSTTRGPDWAQAINAVSLSEKYARYREYDVKLDGSGMYALVCQANRSMRMTQAELEAHPRWRGLGREASRHAPMRGWLAAPLIGRDGRNLGLIQLSDKLEGDFTAEDEAVLNQLANVASAVVENIGLYHAAQGANRAKDEFLATLSHELRSPLSAVLGWARILRRGTLDRDTAERAVESIERNVRIQTQLIDDLLDVSRIVSGRLKLEVQTVELAPIIETCVDAVRPWAIEKGLRLDVVLDFQAFVSGDSERLQQVMRNLLSNAIKFTPRGGRVQVRLHRTESVAEVVVSDTGQGIEPERLAHVFERLWQADSSTTRRHGGLGLGLAIARHLVQLHGGSIRAESAGPGTGATFTVRLPIALVSAPLEHPSVPQAGAGEPSRLSGVRILVVEDESETRDVLDRILVERGAEVRSVASAGEAFELLGGWVPDVLLSDIGMPGEDGYSLMRRIRALPKERGGRVPAVALTAYVRADDRRRALKAGFQTHVGKPVDPDELALVIAGLAGLGRSR